MLLKKDIESAITLDKRLIIAVKSVSVSLNIIYFLI